MTPLDFATEYGENEVISWLVDHGADIDCKDTVSWWCHHLYELINFDIINYEQKLTL